MAVNENSSRTGLDEELIWNWWDEN